MRVLVLLLLSNALGASAAWGAHLQVPAGRRMSLAARLRGDSLSLAGIGSTIANDGDCCITEAGPGDYEQVLDLTMFVFFGELGSDRGFNGNLAKGFEELEEEQGECLRGILSDPSAVSFKASIDERVVGFVTCSDSDVLTNLAVHPSARRRRVGWRLVQQLLSTERAASVNNRVLLEVDADNQPAFELYRACGFDVIQSDKSGTRYTIDWWRGRTLQEVFKVVMQYTD